MTKDRHGHEGALRKGLGGTIEKGGDGPSPAVFDIAGILILSARSLLISLLPYFPCLT